MSGFHMILKRDLWCVRNAKVLIGIERGLITKMMKNLSFSDTEISGMKSIAEEREFVIEEDKKEIKKFKTYFSENDLILAKLFIKAYDYFLVNVYAFPLEKLKEYLDFYKDNYNVEILREHLNEYHDGNTLGDFNKLGYIKTRVAMSRDAYLELIKLFFNVFDVEEE